MLNTRKRIQLILVAAVLVISSALSIGWAAAQDDTAQGRAYLGVSIEDTADGVAITRVLIGSPADAAGLEVGDLITAINGEEMNNAREVAQTIAGLQPGAVATVEFERAGETQSVEVTLAEAPVGYGLGLGRPDFVMPFRGQGIAVQIDGETGHLTIQSLSEDHPLYEAGLREGDVITAINGEALNSAQLPEILSNLEKGASLTLTVERDGETLDIEIPAETLMSLGMPFGFRFRGEGPMSGLFGMFGGQGRLGVAFVTLDEATAEERGLSVTEGALVTEVMEGTPAAEAGLQVDDIITAVNGDAVDAEHTLRDRLLAYEPGDEVTLTVLRGEETLDITVTLGQVNFGSGILPFFGQDGERMPGLPFNFEFRMPDMPRGFRFGHPDAGIPFDLEPAVPSPNV